MQMSNRALNLLILGLLFLFSCASGPRLIVNPEAGAPIDPGIVYGVLPNGFQYVLMKNTTPEDRVDLHLNVFAGSLNETDDQQGVAHFLEHLLFNGSEHFKPGELVRYFQSMGMDFGGDANANTSFFNTVYDLSLPKGDQKHMEEAFVIIQDYAKGALLLEEEIDRERGIIFAEKRERDSVAYRTFKKTLGFELPDSRFNQRFPIGIDPVLKKADRRLLKAYYDRWYRPDNMALIVVGDFDPKAVLPMITQRFSKLTPRTFALKKSIPTRWEEHRGIKTFYHHEPEAGSTDVTIETASWIPFKAQTLDVIKKRTLMQMAHAMLQNRLSRMVSRQTADFSEASVFSGSFLQNISLSAIHATCEPLKWKQGLRQIENVLRQGLLYGFTDKELDRVKAEFLSSLEQQVDQAGSRKSPDLSRDILATINQGGLLLSPNQKLELLGPYIQAVSVKAAHNALKEAWAKDHRLVLVTGNADIRTPHPETAILEAYRDSLADKVGRYEGFESGRFPYLELPTSLAGTRARRDNVNGLGITTIELENNIRLNLKKTAYKQNEFLFKVCFGEGEKSEPVSMPGLAFVSESVLTKSGLGKLDTDQLEEALAGKNVTIGFDVNENDFSFSGAGDPKEAALIFQLIYHYLKDPGFRAEALDLSRIRYKQEYDSLVRTPEGIMQIKGDRFLAKDDPRFGLPGPEMLNAYTLEDVKHWLAPVFRHSPVEVSLVGDFDLEEMIALASKYMGAVEKRKKFPGDVSHPGKIGFPQGRQLELKVDTKIDMGIVHLAFLTDDFWDIMQTRRLSVLSRVISERLRIAIREDIAETYSPYVYNNPSLIFEGYGVLHAVVNVKPEHHELVYNKIKEIIVSLAREGVSKNEADLALKPVLNQLKVLVKTNGYWLNSVLANASRYPEKLDWALNMTEGYKSITNDDLTSLAKKYLKIENSALIVIKPERPVN